MKAGLEGVESSKRRTRSQLVCQGAMIVPRRDLKDTSK